jgi:hypothetical protein
MPKNRRNPQPTNSVVASTSTVSSNPSWSTIAWPVLCSTEIVGMVISVPTMSGEPSATGLSPPMRTKPGALS